MARAGGPRVRRLFRRAADARNLQTVIFRGIGAILFAAGSAVASGILTIADLFIIPLSEMATVGGEFVNAIFGTAAMILRISGISTATSLGPGGMFNVGPFTWALGFASVLLALYVLRAYISEEPTSNFLPGWPDMPTPGFIGPEEDDKD